MLTIYLRTAMRAVTSCGKNLRPTAHPPTGLSPATWPVGYPPRFIPSSRTLRTSVWPVGVYEQIEGPQVNAGRSDIAIELPEGSGWDWNVLACDGGRFRLGAGPTSPVTTTWDRSFTETAFISRPADFEDPVIRAVASEELPALSRRMPTRSGRLRSERRQDGTRHLAGRLTAGSEDRPRGDPDHPHNTRGSARSATARAARREAAGASRPPGDHGSLRHDRRRRCGRGRWARRWTWRSRPTTSTPSA